MSRSVKNSDDDVEPKIGRTHIRLSTAHSVMNSPLRRSSRIRQAKYSPTSSESDTSIVSNSQPTKDTRKRTATMDSITSEAIKGQRTRKLSASSDISETTIDILGTSARRTTRSSLAATTSTNTPTKINTRAANKRLIRAGSETRSPLPSVRTTRRTRASSVDPESLSNQNKTQPSTPVKVRKRASILPSKSPVKEEVEEKDLIPHVQLNVTIAETDEVTSSDSPDKALVSQQNKEINRSQNINMDEIEDRSCDKIESSSSLCKSDEICQPSKEKEDETVDKKENSIEEQCNSEENMPDDTIITVSIHESSLNSSNSKKEDKLETVKKSVSTKSPTKELGIKIENLLNTFVEEQKRSPSNKENQTLNIASDISEEKMQPLINIIPLDIKSLTSVFVNKSLHEKETISMKNEPNSDKQRHSRELTETTIKHSTVSEENSLEEIIDISTDSSNSDVICEKKNLDDILLNDINKEQNLVHDTDNKLVTINAENEPILSQHDNIEIVDEIIITDEITVENVNEFSENALKEIDESCKVNKAECKESKKTEFNERNETPCSSINQTTIEQKSDYKETSILTVDDIKMTSVLKKQNPCQEENKVSSNVVHSNSDHSIDSAIDEEIPSPLNISSNTQSIVIDEQSAITQDDIVNNTDFTEQVQENLSTHIIESVPESSSVTLEIINSAHNTDVDNTIIQDTQISNITEASKKSAMDTSSEETNSKAVSSENIMKLNIKRKSTDDVFDNLETEKESLQLEKSQKDKTNMESIDNDSDINIDISLFKDIPADKISSCKEKINKKKYDIETNLEHSNPQSVEELENESENECDLVLVDKQAWLAAKNMKAEKQVESFEYDSDDTVLLKSQLDAQASYDAKMSTISEQALIDFDNEENVTLEPIKMRKSLTKRRSVSKKDEDFLTEITDDSLITTDKSLNKSTAVLNRSNDQSVSKLNTSKQIAKTRERLSKTHDELDEEIEDDADELNRSLQISEKNTSLRKSTEGKKSLNKSLNKSLKNTSLKQGNNTIQNISINKSRIDNSEEEIDNTNTHVEKKSQKKRHSLNKSHSKDADNATIEFEELKNVSSKDNERNKNASLNSSIDKKSKLVNIETSMSSNDDKSDNEIIRSATDVKAKIESMTTEFRSKNYSTTAKAGSFSDDSDTIPNFLFERASSDDSIDESINSDIKREYNLDGARQMFSDDNVPADECRASELEFSDSDDNGSDLADFIVNDVLEDEEEEEINNEKNEEEYDEEDEQSMEKDKDIREMEVDDESESEQSTNESDKVIEEKEVEEEIEDEEVEDGNKQLDVEQADMETRDNEDIQVENDILNEKEDKKAAKVEVDTKSNTYDKLSKICKKKKHKFIKYTSPCTSQTEAKRDVKMKENETILLDTPNSDSSIKKKKKSHMEEYEKTILLDKSNSTSSTKKKKKSDPQCSSKDRAEQNSIEQLNESEIMFTRKLQKSHMLMECSTPKLSTSEQKSEINATPETLRKTSEIKNTKSDDTNKTMQNISLKKKKSKKHSALEEDVSLREFNRTSKKEKILESTFPSDILTAIRKTSVRPISSKMSELHKTMNVTHTLTPTIRYLRKEKLNESAPASKLNTIPLRKTLLLAKEEKDIVQIEIKEKNDKKEVSDLAMPSNDDAIQKHSQRKQKKRKKQMEENEMDENIDEASQDTIELNALKKKKRAKLSQFPIVEDNTYENTCHINKKEKKEKKKKKKKQIDITEQEENVNEDNIIEKNSCKKKMELAQHKKKHKEIVNTLKQDSSTDNYVIVKKKAKRQEEMENKEILPEKLPKKKKKEEKTLPLQAIVPKVKSEKKSLVELNRPQSQNTISDTIKSKNTAFAKARNEALEAIYAAEMRIKNKKELKKKKKRQDVKNEILEQNVKILTKKRKKETVKEMDKSSSSNNLTRLPDDVIENLTDMPRKIKRRKLSRKEEQIMPSLLKDNSKSKATIAKNDDFIALSGSGSTTKFGAINLRKTKQPLKESAAASFRQKMLARNSREPISVYTMYLEKQAASKKKLSNVF